ncbi:DUF2911 domain-containing protein [Flaviaesturariibacter amylovorans]|uniref:DUF2911 domain-containing protein n=1 Tax=Flaviaesturariibacter amylovorans TaxID=1084520 RepID=A0ABP8H1X6_9BACT
MFKRLYVTIAASCLLLTADAQGLRTPAPSPSQMVRQDFGISSVELNYSRPAMRGRTIMGDLVPYGKVWRTGANSATRLKFADDVTIGGQALKAGEYAVFTIPGQREWEIIINKGTANWGTDYKQENDVIRFKAPVSTTTTPVESFTIQFANIKSTAMDIQMMWDRTVVTIPVSVDVDKKIMGQIDQLMNRDNRPYFNAAMYYMENGKDLNQALLWFDKAAEANPDAYWIQHQRANALAKLGRKQDAMAAAQKSMEGARKAGNEDYVRLNEKLLASLK